MERIIKTYYEQSQANKLDNQEETGKFPVRYNVPRLNYKEIANLFILITSKKIESVIKNLLTMKTLGPDGFTGGF